MAYASSISSAGSRGAQMSAKIRALSLQKGRPHVTVSLDGYQDSWIATYSTLDRINGTVDITCPSDTPIERLEIDFAGVSHTFVERLSSATATSGRTQASHQFLKLTQPIPASAWPIDKILLGGRTYSFRFLFVVPEQLLARACHHTVTTSMIQQEHLQLPPSLGDAAVSGRGATLLDDFAPDMVRVRYAVSATVTPAHPEGQSARPIMVSKKIRIIPASEERAPLAEGPQSDYTMRVEKDLRKGVFKGKLGRLVVEATQPRAIRMPFHDAECHQLDSTAVTIDLRFDPVEGTSEPPRLGSIATRLKVNSFFSTTARTQIPCKKDVAWDTNQGVHTEVVTLASRPVSNVGWTFRPDGSSSPSSDLRRRDSSYSSCSEHEIGASSKYNGAGYYAARILMPITLPANKAWVPTFHSCLVSRTYTISMQLGVGSGTRVDLRVPVQISSVDNPAVSGQRDTGGLSMEEQAVEALDADDFFVPRTPRPTGASLGGDVGGDLPPGYDDFSRGRTRVGVMV